jgi:hypothetical protein
MAMTNDIADNMGFCECNPQYFTESNWAKDQ